MSGETREQGKADIKRKHIASLMNQGLSASKIAKETGYSYKHVRQIMAQEKPEESKT